MTAEGVVSERGGRRHSRRTVARLVARRALDEFGDDRCPQFAAAIAYHVLFSLFPLAILLTAIFGIVVRTTGVRADVVDAIASALPLSARGTDNVRDMLRGVTGDLSALGLLGLIGVVYSASGMMAAIRAAVAAAFDTDDQRPFLRGKLVDLALVAVAATGAVASLALTIVVRALGGGHDVRFQFDVQAGWPGWVMSTIVPLAVAFTVVLGLYRFVPAASVRLRHAAPVALGVAVVFVLAENLFAVYVGHFADYSAVYGSLGAVIAFMVFVDLGAMLFLLGAEAVSEWPRAIAALERGEGERDAGGDTPVRRFLRGLWTRRP